MPIKNLRLRSIEGIFETPFLTPNSKRLIKAGWRGQIKEFSEELCKYKWNLAQDYTIAVIMLTIVVAWSKATEIQVSAKQRDESGVKKAADERITLSEYINRKVNSSKVKELFQKIINIEKIGDSNNIANSISRSNTPHGWFAKCFCNLIAQHKDDKTPFNDFLKRVKKNGCMGNFSCLYAITGRYYKQHNRQ